MLLETRMLLFYLWNTKFDLFEESFLQLFSNQTIVY